MTKFTFPEELDKSFNQMKKDEHKKRMASLRKEFDYLEATDWQFKSPDDLVGK